MYFAGAISETTLAGVLVGISEGISEGILGGTLRKICEGISAG